ncbi:hypothetical protein COV19_01995 [Candidatus Woesearchaeota archaeon CG10_big_fil_rev_8_21_14_0_10_44_13]|nr:MAG: hypothetical protein COV19_01995 [Candidatus Woesearchaeota archaeon CG10_big_fil_rev_8_21_14_0_10_44_13]
MWEIVRELSAKNKIYNILEFGCGNGNFVTFLRDENYNAFGIDMQEKGMSETGINEGYLAVCSIENYHGLFGEIPFDMVIANHVMSIDATVTAIMNLSRGSNLFLAPSQYIEAWETNTSKILEIAHHNLRKGGFFADVEFKGEQLSPNIRRYAPGLGYKLISYSPQEIILQKQD